MKSSLNNNKLIYHFDYSKKSVKEYYQKLWNNQLIDEDLKGTKKQNVYATNIRKDFQIKFETHLNSLITMG